MNEGTNDIIDCSSQLASFFRTSCIRSSRLLVASAVSAFFFLAEQASAGPFQDDLIRCVGSSISSQDKVSFAAFIALAMSRLPELDGVVLIDAERSKDIVKNYALAIERLILVDCVQQSKQVIKMEGPQALAAVANEIGQMALREKLSGPEMITLLDEMEQYVDTQAWDSLMLP